MSADAPLPPFDEVLTALDLRAEAETRACDVTIGRTPQSLPGDDSTHPTLPEIVVALGGEGAAAAGRGPSDLDVATLIGRGGMGEVWLARQRSLGRDVAIKTTTPGSDARVDHALVTEARITGALEHPSIVPVHALGQTTSGRPVLVMKRIEGVVWRTLLRSPNHPHWANLGPEEPLVVHVQILMQICNALELAHRRGVVHRDVKPDNVMVGAFGEVYLVDWGLATEMGQPQRGPRRVEGTPAYMAPEMIAGLAVDARTDVFLLGATLHEVLTGAPPHAGHSLATVLERAYHPVVHDYPDAPEELAMLCRQAMSRDAAERPPSARAFRDHLATFLRHRASTAILRRGRTLLAEIHTAGATRARLDECLVTLRLALTEWSDSPQALAALHEWRVAALAAAIDEGNLAGAEDLLAEMGEAPTDLTVRLDQLRQRIERERREAEHGRRAAFEGDAGIGARERRLLGLVMAAGLVLVASVALPYSIRGTLTTGQILRFAVAACVPFVLVVIALRRRLLMNSYARRTVAMLGLVFALILVHRTAAWLADRPVPETLVADLLVVAGACGVGGIVLARWWYAGLVAGLTGACLGIWQPALAAPALTMTALVVALAAVISWSRDVRTGASGHE